MGEVAWVKTCPCGAHDTHDICDPVGIKDTAEGGFWKCGWHRNGVAQQRMNRCHWTCRGDNYLSDADDVETGAKMRCFREQGKRFREGTRKRRDLGKWELGRNSDGLVSCSL